MEAVQTHGWTREGLDAMHKLDSFIKETQRIDTSAESEYFLNHIFLSPR